METSRRLRTRGVPALTALAAVTAACGQPTAEQVVSRVAEAMTGSTRGIEAVRTLRVRIVYPDHAYPVVVEVRRPNRMRTEGVGSYVLVFDGERAAFLESPPAEDGTPRGPELVDPRYVRDLELDIAFVFPAFFDYPSEYLGRDTLDGVETHKLGVALPLGIRTTYFIDAESWLPVRVVAAVTVDSVEYHPGRVFRDYAERGGLRYPTAMTYWWMPEETQTAAVEAVEINPRLGDERFAIPPEVR